MKKIRTDILDDLLDETEFGIHIKTKKKTLILEGTSDLLFFRILIDKSSVPVTAFCVNGKDSKKQLIELFNKHPEIQNNNLYLGIVDKDHDQAVSLCNNLLYTDFADLDCYYIHFSGFENFIREFLNNAEVSKLIENKQPSQNINELRKKLHISIIPLTHIRRLNSKYKVPLGKIFKKSPLEERKERYKKFKKIIGENNEINEELLFTYLRSTVASLRSGGHYEEINFVELREEINKLDNNSAIEMLTNGHDLISFVTHLHNLKNTTKNDVQVEEVLRLTVHLSMFAEFPLTNAVAEWVLSPKQDSNKLVASAAE